MLVEIVLAAWTCAGAAWGLISWRLVTAANKAPASIPSLETRQSLSIFKPLPPLGPRGLDLEARGLESFIAQLDSESELLLGVHEADWISVEPFLARMRATYPLASITFVRRTDPDQMANPKIDWQRHLAPLAKGDLWLWSDADIVAPPGFLDQARAEYQAANAGLLTFPYAVRTIPRGASLPDALFVNAEFYPGVLLLRHFGPVDFGLGAAMLFHRDHFQARIDWSRLGAALADDFTLGQMLQPVRIGQATLETVADVPGWPEALTHYYRWKKTVFWCRPGGFASQIIIMPVLGWLLFALLHPATTWAWFGLLGTMQLEVLFAALICRILGCPLAGRLLLLAEAWSLGRVLFWLFCLLPIAPRWGGRTWQGPTA